MIPPRATVRLQFNAGFTLDDAVAVVPYYAALGTSHVYASPLLASRRGSTHGYDGVRTDRIDDELGGEPALRRLVAALRAHAMGLVLDIVPNHMSASLENPWWLDLLEHGRRSAFADTFDVDWDSGNGRVLLPWLQGPLHQRVAAGDASLRYDPATRRIYVHAGPAQVPLAADTYAQVLDGSVAGSAGGGALAPFAARLGGAATTEEFAAARDGLATALEREPLLQSALEAALEAYLPVDADRSARLRALLARQPWQLADWQAAPRRINWRRFFDIGALVALRIEDPQVFDAVHAYPLALFAEGLIDGLRIDHVDGLRNPAGYCRRLRAELQRSAALRPPGLPRSAWLVVEKILAGDEALRDDWAIDGSTGYDFMEQVGAVLHDASGEAALTRAWEEVAPPPAGAFAAVALQARHEILATAFAADLQRAARALAPLLDLPAEDPTLLAALRELVACFPVYRTYIEPGRCAADDRRVLDAAVADAQRTLQHDGPARVLLQRLPDALCAAPATDAQACADALAALQQLTPPIAAKAIEDTAFYRYGRLLSRNEVGADPGRLAAPVQRFHDQCRARARDWPRALLATATHDHKRGEDARARLAVLSSEPRWWAHCLAAWRRRHAGLRPGPGPDPADEAMLYQSLLGAWPPQLLPADAGGVHALAERMAAWQEKALREAKRHTSWHAPDPTYEAACAEFLRRLFANAVFVGSLHAAVEHVAPAGALRALAQMLLRLTAPGVPDLYQGTEFWDHSLVDPDNRRAVDHALRARTLAADAPLPELLASWRDGRIKQRLLARALALRRELPELFAVGAYEPLAVEGPAAASVIAFVRRWRDVRLLVLVPVQLPAEPAAGGILRVRSAEIAGTQLRGECLRGRWTPVPGGAPFDLHDGTASLARVLHDCPVALLLQR